MIVPRSSSGSVQLVARELSRDGSGDLLVALPPESGLPVYFAEECPRARYLHLDYAVFLRDLAQMPDASGSKTILFGDRFDEIAPAARAVIFLPKEKALAEFVFAELARRLPAGAHILVAGENRGGIRSIKPLIESTLGPVSGSRSGRHAVVWEARRGTDPPPPRDLRRRFTVQAGGESFAAVSYPGVFSHGELDPGTQLLLDSLGRPSFRRGLDWACGAGVVGTFLRRIAPEAWVDLVDSHALALRSARETLQLNGLPADRVYPSDVFSDVRGTFDLIVANPPFHRGVGTELTVGERMIRECGRYLLPGGRLVMVANSFLRYPARLRESFRDVRILAETPSYRVYEATNP